MNEKIDIVILWVDGNDPKWLEEKNKFLHIKGDSKINRFRDCDNLQYLFRGIEKYASWVNKVYFVTWGHLPKWLNTNNEKLEIVKHEDFIPAEYLPTFNSNVIEMNLHRIKNLSNQFILFNDDLFILKKLKKEDFFKNGIPRDMYIEYKKKNPSKRHIILKENYSKIISKYFIKKDFIKQNLFKVFNVRYGLKNIKTLCMLKNKKFEDIYSEHLAQPFLKETFEDVWKLEENILNQACYNRFRAENDIGQAICRYFNLLSGQFIPCKSKGKYFVMSNNNLELKSVINKQKYKIICINDSKTDIDFEKAKNEINESLKNIFSEKCSFEK